MVLSTLSKQRFFSQTWIWLWHAFPQIRTSLHYKFFNVMQETIPGLPTTCPSSSQHSLTHILSSSITKVISVSSSCWTLCHLITPTFSNSPWTSPFPGSFHGFIQVEYSSLLLYSQYTVYISIVVFIISYYNFVYMCVFPAKLGASSRQGRVYLVNISFLIFSFYHSIIFLWLP